MREERGARRREGEGGRGEGKKKRRVEKGRMGRRGRFRVLKFILEPNY